MMSKEQQSLIYECPSCGADPHNGWTMTAKRQFPGVSDQLFFLTCSKCDHRAITDGRGREYIPGKHLAADVWSQVTDPEWTPHLLTPKSDNVTIQQAANKLGCTIDFVHVLLSDRKLVAAPDNAGGILVVGTSIDQYVKSLLGGEK